LGAGFGVTLGEELGTGVMLGFGGGVVTGAGEGAAAGSWRSLLAAVGAAGSSCSPGLERSASGGGVFSIAVSVCSGALCAATSVPPLIQTMLCKFGLRASRFQRTSVTMSAM